MILAAHDFEPNYFRRKILVTHDRHNSSLNSVDDSHSGFWQVSHWYGQQQTLQDYPPLDDQTALLLLGKNGLHFNKPYNSGIFWQLDILHCFGIDMVMVTLLDCTRMSFWLQSPWSVLSTPRGPGGGKKARQPTHPVPLRVYQAGKLVCLILFYLFKLTSCFFFVLGIINMNFLKVVTITVYNKVRI